jgi:hypothetical protein
VPFGFFARSRLGECGTIAIGLLNRLATVNADGRKWRTGSAGADDQDRCVGI